MDWQRAYFREQADPQLRKTWPTMAVLMTYADRDLECYPSQATIAKIAGIKDPETVRRHLKANQDAGWLVRFHAGGPGVGTNHYRFVIPSPLQSGEAIPAEKRSPLQSGDIPATQRGPIPAAEQSKLSRRTVHKTVLESDQKTSPLHSGEGNRTATEETDPWGSVIDLPATETRTVQPYPRYTAGTSGSQFNDPFSDESLRQHAEHAAEAAAREERARLPEPAMVTWRDDPFG